MIGKLILWMFPAVVFVSCKPREFNSTQTEAALNSVFTPVQNSMTVVRDSARLVIAKNNERRLYIRVTDSETQKIGFENFSRYCLVDYNNIMTMLTGKDRSVFSANRTYPCFRSFENLRNSSKQVVWKGDVGYARVLGSDSTVKDASHRALQLSCGGVRNKENQYTCEVHPADKADLLGSCENADHKKYAWAWTLGPFVCLAPHWSYVDNLEIVDQRGCINSRGERTTSGRDGSFVCINSRWSYSPPKDK